VYRTNSSPANRVSFDRSACRRPYRRIQIDRVYVHTYPVWGGGGGGGHIHIYLRCAACSEKDERIAAARRSRGAGVRRLAVCWTRPPCAGRTAALSRRTPQRGGRRLAGANSQPGSRTRQHRAAAAAWTPSPPPGRAVRIGVDGVAPRPPAAAASRGGLMSLFFFLFFSSPPPLFSFLFFSFLLEIADPHGTSTDGRTAA